MSLYNIFDSHAHYDDARFSDDLPELLASLPAKGVVGVISCGVNTETSRFAARLAATYDYIYAAAGFHPLNLADVPENPTEILRELLQNPKTVAVGEIGLDYYYEKASRDAQLQLFELQLRLANELSLPVIVHDREAHAEVYELLKKYKPKGVLHCYSGSADDALWIARQGMLIGFGGSCTFKGAKRAVKAIQALGLENIVLETDCPYMAPEPVRGSRCDSGMIRHVGEFIAQHKGVSADEVFRITCQNAHILYGLK